jgi:DNA repair protein RecO (recombination protein O)
MQRRGEQALVGTVVRLAAYGESDRIVELVTAEQGKVALLARGGRASKKRFAGALDLFIGLRAHAIPGPRLWTMHTADLLAPRAGIRTALERIARASLLCECASLLVPEHHEAPDAAVALGAGLDALDRGDTSGACAAYPWLLRASGIMPSVPECARCGSRSRLARLDATAGGAVCSSCAPSAPRLSDGAWAVLAGSPCSDAGVGLEVEEMVAEVVEANAGRALKSRRAFVVRGARSAGSY